MMNQKKLKYLWKSILVIALLLVAYFSIMLAGGGFGKKPVHIEAMKDGNAAFLFAHRGISEYYPENTRESIEAAKIKGFKGLEIDIRKSADNEFIIFHDEDGKRLLGVSNKIFELSTAQIMEHRLIFNGNQTTSSVITLKEMLDEYKDDFIFYFDLKLKGLDDADELARLIKSYDLAPTSIIASTNASLIFYVEYKYPEINTALEGFNAGKEWLYCLMPKNLKPDFFSSYAGKVNEKHISWLRKKDLISSRIVYDVDSANYHQVIQWGLKNLVIDFDSTLRVP